MGEMVQRVGKTIVDGRKVKFAAGVSGEFVNLTNNSSPGIVQMGPYINTYFPNTFFSSNANYGFIFTEYRKMAKYFETPNELNAFCIERYEEGNPLTIFYSMRSPIHTPLTAEERSQLKALRTYSPKTTVINDADAGMSVGYKRK